MLARLAAITNLQLHEKVPLARFTRFGIGGATLVVADAPDENTLVAAANEPHTLIGGGTNLIVADAGHPGMVLRYTAPAIEIDGDTVRVEAGAVLQHLVDRSIAAGLHGLHTMTGIPGWVGGAVYGNAGAYGHSIHEFVTSVRFYDGARIRSIGNAECEFRYRESVFKRHKNWIILSAELRLQRSDAQELARAAKEILDIRNAKYPPEMRCAGSIFKNLLLAELPADVGAQVPERVIREGKVPSAWFLEEVGAKGMVRGGIRVADYHANLIYNAGGGTASQICEIIDELKQRVWRRFALELEEEVQYVGFTNRPCSVLGTSSGAAEAGKSAGSPAEKY
jgi:UDP-N-acetylmuramate dehydrogenase